MGSLFGSSKQVIIWIDQRVYENSNREIYNQYFLNNSNFIFHRCITVDEGIQYIIQNNFQFREIKIIVSGKLYMEFYYKFKEISNGIKFNPNIIIFLNRKNAFIEELKLNNLYYNNELLNPKLITNEKTDLKDFVGNCHTLKEKDVTFEIIDNYGQLIIPNYISYLFENVTSSEIYYFNDYLNQVMKDNSIVKGINDNNILKSSLCKYWLRSYTMNTDFYPELNKNLRNNINIHAFFPIIKLCYEGLRKGYLTPATRGPLYRCSKISIEEFKNINDILKKNNQRFPKIMLCSKSFLSFSTKPNVALDFLEEPNNKKEKSVLYIINNDKDFDKNTISNAYINDISVYGGEKEVLIFPFSCFEVVKVGEQPEISIKGINYNIIELRYLGKYENKIKERILRNHEEIRMTNYLGELNDSNILEENLIDSISPFWYGKEKHQINEEISKICFLLDNNEDLIGYHERVIKVISLNGQKKQDLKVHDGLITCIIKLNNERICSSSEDKTIKIIKLKKIENNYKYSIIRDLSLSDSAKYMIYLNSLNEIRILKNNNKIDSYNIDNKQIVIKKLYEENDEIILIKELPNKKLFLLQKINKIIILLIVKATTKILKLISVLI